MIYIGVEFRDKLRGRTRELWAVVPYDTTNADDEIPFDPMLCDDFEDWVEDGVDPEWYTYNNLYETWEEDILYDINSGWFDELQPVEDNNND